MVNSKESDHLSSANHEDEPRPILETVEAGSQEHKDTNDNDIKDDSEVELREIKVGVSPRSTDSSPPIDYSPIGEIEESGSGHLKIYIILGVIFFIVVASLVFLFNTIKKGIAPKQIKLVYWGLWEDRAVIDSLIEEFEKDHKNITIEYIKQSPDNYREKILARTKDFRGPDIFRFHNTWLPMLHDTLAPIQKDVMTNDEFEKTFYKIASEDLKVGGAYYGIPLYIDNLVLIYNNDFFKRVGISSRPKTWDDLIKIAKQLTVVDSTGNPVTSGIALGTASNIDHFSDIIGWMLLQNGGDLKDVSAVEGEQVLKKYREFAEPPNPVWSENMSRSVPAFQEGKVAMIFAPSWQIANINSVNSDIDMKVSELPVLPGETEPFSIANYWVEGVTRNSKNQKEAWQFLKYLSSRDVQERIFDLQTKVRGLGSVSSRVDLKETLLQNELLAPVVAQAPYLKTIPTISRTYDNGLNDQINSYLEDAINNAQNGVSYNESMRTAKDGIVSVLEKYNIN